MFTSAFLKTYKAKVDALEEQRKELFKTNNVFSDQLEMMEAAGIDAEKLTGFKDILSYGRKRELEMMTTITQAKAQLDYIGIVAPPDKFDFEFLSKSVKTMVDDLHKGLE